MGRDSRATLGAVPPPYCGAATCCNRIRTQHLHKEWIEMKCLSMILLVCLVMASVPAARGRPAR